MAKEISIQAQVAKLIRAELKSIGVQARVRSSSASMMNSVDVDLNDPTPSLRKQVSSIVEKYQSGKFDSQMDAYVYSSNPNGLPRVKYATVYADFSDDLRQRALDVMRSELPFDPNLVYDDMIIGIIPAKLSELVNEQSRLIYRICMGSDINQSLSNKLWLQS